MSRTRFSSAERPLGAIFNTDGDRNWKYDQINDVVVDDGLQKKRSRTLNRLASTESSRPHVDVTLVSSRVKAASHSLK